MSRKSRNRASRTLTGFVAIAAVTGGAFQFHHIRAARAQAAALREPAQPTPRPPLAAAATTGSPAATALAGPASPAPAPTPAPPAPNFADAAVMRSSLPLLAAANQPMGAAQTASSSLASPPGPSAAAHPGSPLAAGAATQPSAGSFADAAAAGPSPQLASAALPPAGVIAPADGAQSLRSASSNPLRDAQTAFAAGELLNARKILNDALNAGTLSPADADAARAQISQISDTLVFSSQKFPDDPYGGIITVHPGQKLSSIAATHDITWELLLRLNNLSDPRKLRAGQTLKVIQGPFQAVVTKHAFTMDLYLGGTPGSANCMYVTSYKVGLGKDDSTPTGTWMIEPHHKIKHPTYYSPRGEGVIAADDPKNPLGPVWMGLTGTDGHAVGKQSYGIHGTIEPDSIGHMASMGCIRMRNDQVALVFEMLTEGKSIVVVRD